MRNCLNCYNFENSFCNEKLDNINPYYSCDSHRFPPNEEEEKNYIYYDEKYLAPGFLIINTENGVMKKVIKLYRSGKNDFYTYGIRVYDFDNNCDNDLDYHTIDFYFRDLEDYENHLYNIFSSLSFKLTGKIIKNINNTTTGNNYLKLSCKNNIVKLSIYKDIYGSNNISTDITIGDKYNCDYYDIFEQLYNELDKVCHNILMNNEIQKLVLSKK